MVGLLPLLIAGAVKKVLTKTRERTKNFPVLPAIAQILKILSSRVVFWLILIIAVIGALNVLNLTSVSGPFSNMVQQFLLFIPQLLAAVAVGLLAGLWQSWSSGFTKGLDRTAAR